MDFKLIHWCLLDSLPLLGIFYDLLNNALMTLSCLHYHSCCKCVEKREDIEDNPPSVVKGPLTIWRPRSSDQNVWRFDILSDNVQSRLFIQQAFEEGFWASLIACACARVRKPLWARHVVEAHSFMCVTVLLIRHHKFLDRDVFSYTLLLSCVTSYILPVKNTNLSHCKRSVLALVQTLMVNLIHIIKCLNHKIKEIDKYI